jgi:ADP-heptose:LPS heptosyltransferase
MKALAIRAGALGDTIVALPAIAALAALPARVELVGTSPYIELARAAGLAAATHSIDRARFRALFDAGADDAELVEFLEGFDLVVAWSRIPALAATLGELGVDLLQADPLPPPAVHASDHLFRALAPLGIRGPAPYPRLRVEERPRLPSLDRRFVAIHPSSGSVDKNWPSEHFESLARRSVERGLDVVWIQGEADREVVAPLARAVSGSVAGELPIRELAGLLCECALFVGNDSGVSHLAAAVGAPTLTLFRSTEPAQWAPRGPRVQVVRAGASAEAVWGFATDLMASC